MDEFLKSLGFNYKFDELSKEEKDTLFEWLDKTQNNQLTVADIRKYITNMRDAVEMELTKTTNNSLEDILLKARLRNYMLLGAFMETADRARAALQRAGVKV